MQSNRVTRCNRRMLLAMLTSTQLMTSRNSIESRRVFAQDTTEISDGIHILDYRLFPTVDVSRFIVEVSNNSHEAVDTPAVGLILPQFPSSSDFGFALPVDTVLHPNSRGLLVGVAPASLTDDDIWEEPEWSLCNPVVSLEANAFSQYEIDIIFTSLTKDPDQLVVAVTITNRAQQIRGQFEVSGIVRDGGGRICGCMLPRTIYGLEHGQSKEFTMSVSRDDDFIGNPFVLVDSAYDMEVELSFQPVGKYLPPNCSAVMPWNR